jgi:hypothetical protein
MLFGVSLFHVELDSTMCPLDQKWFQIPPLSPMVPGANGGKTRGSHSHPPMAASEPPHPRSQTRSSLAPGVAPEVIILPATPLRAKMHPVCTSPRSMRLLIRDVNVVLIAIFGSV